MIEFILPLLAILSLIYLKNRLSLIIKLSIRQSYFVSIGIGICLFMMLINKLIYFECRGSEYVQIGILFLILIIGIFSLTSKNKQY